MPPNGFNPVTSQRMHAQHGLNQWPLMYVTVVGWPTRSSLDLVDLGRLAGLAVGATDLLGTCGFLCRLVLDAAGQLVYGAFDLVLDR